MIYIEQFDRLLDNLPNFDASKYHGMGYAIRDWIDADDQRSGTNGAEDQDYLSQDPPYRAANQPFRSVSELMLVKGMTKELYAALQPYVAALPTTPPGSVVPANPTNPANLGGNVTPINVNTAPEPVLLSLAPNITNKAAVERFIAIRKTQPITNPGDLNVGSGSSSGSSSSEIAFIPPSTGTTNTGTVLIAVLSNYFELQAEVFIGSGRLALYSVFYRANGTPVVLAHSTNTE
jgi:general secretion pathway protein K